jgi:para-nitrobenzyl esterase
VPGDRLIAATTRRDPTVLDGHVLTGTAEQIFERRQQSDVPVLIGYTRDESFRPFGAIRSAAELQAAVRELFPEKADAILAAYAGTDPARAASDIARDASVGRQMADWASYQQRYGAAPAYAFFFTRRQPYAPGITFNDHDPATVGAYHSGDIPYWLRTRDAFNLFRTTRNWEPGDVALERTMSDALISFARDGKPVSAQEGAWPVFAARTPRLMWLGLESRPSDWPHFADMERFGTTVAAARPRDARPRD